MVCLSDVGACKKIVDGKIKIKNGSSILRITENSLIFADDVAIEADIIVLATGYVSLRVAQIVC